MRSIRILVAESKDFAPEAADILRSAGQTTFADLDRAGLLRQVSDADVLWVRLRNRIDAEVLAAAKNLQVIVSPTTGLNHIDLNEAERRGIRVLSLRGETSFLQNVRATAEHTIALMLALLRHLPEASEHVHSGGWTRDLFKGRELYRRSVGIIGYGRLGRIVARYLDAFGARVLVCDRPGKAIETPAGITNVAIDELLRDSDIVSLHVDLNPDTERFFGRQIFDLMKDGAIFINTARGELVDEAALLDALRSGRLSGAALDVLSHEDAAGMGAHPLVVYAREHSNLIITPHIGGCTNESLDATEIFLAGRFAELWAKVAA